MPVIDGAWMGVYRSGRDDLLGVASLDIVHWQEPDDAVHPHRMPDIQASVNGT